MADVGLPFLLSALAQKTTSSAGEIRKSLDTRKILL